MATNARAGFWMGDRSMMTSLKAKSDLINQLHQINRL